jgi:replicative DNA helicase
MIDKKQFVSGICDLYDNRLLENSLTAEGNVCGVLLSDLTFFDDCGLEAKDFVTKHGRMLFSIGKQLREKGLSNFDEITLLSNINDDVKEKIDNELGGYKAIQNIIDVVSIKNMDAFMDELNKRNILMSLYKKNFNIFEEMTLDNGKKIVPYKLFEKLSSSEVLDWYNAQLTTLTTKINSSKILDESYIDFDDAFLDSLEQQEEMGVSFGDAGLDINGEVIRTFEFMSKGLMGLKHSTLSAFAATSGCGKSTYLVGTLMSLASKGERVCLLSNESQLADIKVQFLVWFLARYMNYWKVSKRKLISGKLTDEDKVMIKKARKIYREKFGKSIKVVTMADMDSKLNVQIIKNAILRDGISCFAIDTFKLSFNGDRNDSFWLQLVEDTRALAELCLKYNVIGLMTIQLAINAQNRSWLTAECLSNSKAIKEVLSNLVLFRKAIPDLEFDPGSPYYISPFRSKLRKNAQGEDEWYREPYEPDPSKIWRVFFIDKARRGPDSNDLNEAYLCRFDADHASFYETAKCVPSRRIFNTEASR